MAPATGQIAHDLPGLVLEIIHGRTQFKERPVTAGRFLIGSGEGCDLRLNGAEIPALHTVLVLECGHAILEAIAEAPALVVNGQPVREAIVHDGDLIRIGLFELRARFTAPPPSSGAVVAEVEPPASLQGLTATQLIERLERETALVAETEQKRRLGAAALVAAALQRAKTRPAPAGDTLHGPHFNKRPAAKPAEAPDALARELDGLARVLEELTKQLDQQQVHASHRETTYAAAAEELLESHDKLAERVEWLTRQLSDLQARLPAPRSRAIA